MNTPFETHTLIQAVYLEVGKLEVKLMDLKTKNEKLLTNTQVLCFDATSMQLLALESLIHDLYDEALDLIFERSHPAHRDRLN